MKTTEHDNADGLLQGKIHFLMWRKIGKTLIVFTLSRSSVMNFILWNQELKQRKEWKIQYSLKWFVLFDGVGLLNILYVSDAVNSLVAEGEDGPLDYTKDF